MAGIEVAGRLGDTHDGTVKRLTGEALSLEEGLAQEEGEVGVAVSGQPPGKSARPTALPAHVAVQANRVGRLVIGSCTASHPARRPRSGSRRGRSFGAR